MLVDENSRPQRLSPWIEHFDVDKLINTWNFIPQPAAFFRKEVFMEAGMLDINFHYHMDHDLWIKIGRKFAVERVPYVLANMRIHPEAKTWTGGEKRWREIFEIVNKYGTVSDFHLAQRHLDLAMINYRARRIKVARGHFWQALKLHPPYLKKLWIIAFFLKSLFGTRLIVTASDLKKRYITGGE